MLRSMLQDWRFSLLEGLSINSQSSDNFEVATEESSRLFSGGGGGGR